MTQPSGVRLHWSRGHADQDCESSEVDLVQKTASTSGLRIIRGDNLAVLRALSPEVKNSVRFIYLDPPFFTMRQHERVSRTPKPGAPPVRILTPAFDDRWENLGAYLDTLYLRLLALRPLLTPDGSLVVHVDPRTSHYVKIIGDEIFGADAFASEIIWRYRRWPAKTPNFQKVHDVLLRWVRDPSQKPCFVQQYEDLAASTLKTWGRSKQQAVFDASGRRRRSSTLEQASPGAPLGDVWDIPIVAPVSRERTGYPTQKPEALAARLIESCSVPGDLVLDPCLGSGTTLAVAARLGRRAIGIDQSVVAITVARERLDALGISASEYEAVPRAKAPIATRQTGT